MIIKKQVNRYTHVFFKLSSCIFLALIIYGCKQIKLVESDKKVSTKPLVLTTFTVLSDISKNVAGDRLTVQSITKQGAEIHGYKPTPSDLKQASVADLIVENGLGLELWAEKYTSAAGNIPRVVLTDGMQPLLISGDKYKGKPNPHAWMSPKRAMHYVDKLVEAFIEIDPLGEKTFIENAKVYKSKLQNLDKELDFALKRIPAEKRLLVTCEGAFSYLAKDYGMNEAYLWPVNAESQVTPKRMRDLIQIIKSTKVPAVFCESTVSSKAQLEVVRISGAKFGGTFYVDSLSGPSGPASTFIDLQRHNVKLIVNALVQPL